MDGRLDSRGDRGIRRQSGSQTTEFGDGFEDGTHDGWSPLWLPENEGGPNTILNDWAVTEQSNLPGDYSLKLHSRSDHNAIVTDDFVLDLSEDFGVRYHFYFEDDDSRGAKVNGCDTDANGSESGDRVSMERLSPFVAAARRPADDEARLNLLGNVVTLPMSAIDAGTAHTAGAVRDGETITGYLDGEPIQEITVEDAETDLTTPYRLVLQSSGAWGDESTIWWDEIQFAGEGTLETSTTQEPATTQAPATTTTTTSVPTTSTSRPTTETPTTQPPQTTTAPPRIENSARRREVDVGYASLYVHTGIEGYPDDVRGVTTGDDVVAPPGPALDAVLLDMYQQNRFTLDWSALLDEMQVLREQSHFNQLFGQAVDLGWDLTEILIFTSTGNLPAAAGPTFEIMSDAVTWNVQNAERPYRQAFQEITAGVKSVRDTKAVTADVQSYTNVGDTLKTYGGLAMELDGLVSDGLQIGNAWSQMLQGVQSGTGTSLASASSNVLQQTRGIFLSQAVGAVVGELEGVIKAKTTIHAIINALASCQIPVLRELERMDSRFETGQAVPSLVPLYMQSAVQHYQMLAVGHASVGNYWERISESASGGIWDFITNADEKATERAQQAEQFTAMMQTVNRTYGRSLRTATGHLENSPTAEAYDPPTGDWASFVAGGAR